MASTDRILSKAVNRFTTILETYVDDAHTNSDVGGS